MKRNVMKRISVLVGAAVGAFAFLSVFPVYALAGGFVTGSANTNGFSIVGVVHDRGNGKGSGFFTIIVHRDTPEGATAAAVCDYKHFDGLVISGNIATFHSIGACQVLTTTGDTQPFTSDNNFLIVDNGVPGAGKDGVDVNLASGSGVTIPGSFLVNGNFIVSP
jgi:hypothetical protein